MMTPACDNIRRCAATPTHVDQRESELIVVEGPLQPYTPMYGKKEIPQRPSSVSSVLLFWAQNGQCQANRRALDMTEGFLLPCSKNAEVS